MKSIIGIAGKAGAGKDTLAGLLVEHRGYTRRAFADALKEDMAFLLLGEKATGEDVDAIKHIPQIRSLLQAYGEAQRALDPDHWIKRVLTVYVPKSTYFVSSHDAMLVIPDVRYRNECEAIKARGGTLIRVVRPGLESPLTADQQAYISETQLDDYNGFDFTVVNNGTPDYMLLQLEAKMQRPNLLREVMLDDPAVIKFAVKQALKDAVERGEMPASILEALD